ncbi:MAG: hypothetical protein ACE37F_33710 [Nannocystaceae bacterium]|nr:L,D-transpeptidase [bacterium]
MRYTGLTRERDQNSGFAKGLALALTLAVGCSGASKEGKPAESELGRTTAFGQADEADPEEPAQADAETILPLGEITKTSFREHPAQKAWIMAPGEEPTAMDIGQAEARGYTIVDLSNTWTPYIFTEKTPGAEDSTPNGYREKYIGLANDQIDSDGDALGEHGHNYLELYGIPPSLSVIKAEWDAHASDINPCLEEAGFDPEVFKRFDGKIVYRKSGQSKRNRTAKMRLAKLKKDMKKAKLSFGDPADLEAAKTDPRTQKSYENWRAFQDEVDVIDHAQRRFRCEHLFNNGTDGRGKFTKGVYDSATTHALANFERKHDIMGWGHFKRDNLDMLALAPDEASHERVLRAVTERVVTSAGILEDGSAAQWKRGKFRWKDTDGNEHELRDLVTEYSAAAVEALGLQTPDSAEAALAKLSDLGEGNFENLLVAIKMPPKPAYYSDNMQFSAVIDRGDVWYEFPYTEDGKKKSQPRSRYPHLTLYVHYADQKIPLVHWRTTIGSWRNEIKDGEVMLKYKNSDVGDRVWKDIVAAPVWIPPATTPPAELIKGKWKNGKFRRGVNYDEIGPGFRSAYGLVAAYHIKQSKDAEGNVVSEFDNSIRTHGSVDYMSILRRFSHGCHRLYNMDAVRLFTFVLQHRDYTRIGQVPVGVGRKLEHDGRTFHMKIGTRGYKYELVEPIPVTVTRGRIRGSRSTPLEGYLERPLTEEEKAAAAEEAMKEAGEAVEDALTPFF